MTAEALTLGFDLGGTQLRAALVQEGQLLKRVACKTDVAGGPEAVMQQMQDLLKKLCQQAEFKAVQALGMSSPGPLNTETGVIDHIPTLPGWDNFPLKERLMQVFERPTIVENDAIAAAYGEWRYGAGQGLQHLVYVTVSTGIGGGVVMDGRLLHGRRGMAAHIGHFRISSEHLICGCGGRGCFEALASGTALGKRAQQHAQSHPESYLAQLAAQHSLSAADVLDGALAGDDDCWQLLQEEAYYLGLGFTSLLHLYSPERIIMGGGVSQAFAVMKEGIHRVIQREAMPAFKAIKVVPATLQDNAGLIGVAKLALETSQHR